MRLALVSLASLASVTLASAQPVTAPPCDVKIVRAPDDVRAVIESWVKAEPRCAIALEVRVVPTQGGLYLLVRDQHGRERERVVPDAQSAGVLVASWAADDSIIPDQAPAAAATIGPDLPPTPEPPQADVVAPAPARVAAAPGLTPPASTPVGVTATAAAPPPGSKRWLTMGVMGQAGRAEPIGVRAELDLRTRGNWVFAVGASLQYVENELYDGYSWGNVETTDLRAVASIAWTKHRGRWQLRLGAGAGLMFSGADGNFDGQPIQASGVSPTIEVSALISRELTARWALSAGLVVTATDQA